MKRKRTSHGDAMQTVYCAQIDDAQEKLFLIAIASRADWKTGKNAFPGYKFTSAVTETERDRQRIYSNSLVAKGLLELVHKGSGPKDANEYRVCFEHPAFPETYPGRNEEEANPPCVGKAVNPPCAGKAVSLSPTALRDDSNRLVPSDKPPCPTDETALRREVPILDSHPRLASTHTPTSTATTKAGGVCVQTKEEAPAMVNHKTPSARDAVDHAVRRVVYGGTKINPPSEKTRLWMVGKAKECFQASGSTESFEAAGREFLKAKDWEKFRTETHSPWLMFQNGYEKYAGLRDETAKAPELEIQKEVDIDLTHVQAAISHVLLWGSKLGDDPENREWHNKLLAAMTPSQRAEYDKKCAEAGADALFADPPENPSQPTEEVEEEVSKL